MKTAVCRLFLILILCLLGRHVNGQIPSGAWRDHLPYNHGKKLAEYDGRIFCATYDGSLYSYSLKDGSIMKHSKVSGLSDSDISTIGVSESTGTFFIGYRNGNVDLIRNDSIINIPDIKRKMIMGEKSINNVYFHDHYAYLACGFGIVLCDLNKREIRETYYFGPGGSQVFVNDIAFNGTDLVAATEQGIFMADIQNPNLLDFNAWKFVTALPDPESAYKFVVSWNNRLMTLYRNPASGFDQIITFNEAGWETWEHSVEDHFEYFGSQNGSLLFTTEGKTMIYAENGTLSREEVTYFARHLLLDSHDGLWYAALYGGLVGLDKDGNGAAYPAEGPPYRDAGDIEILDGNVWVGGGTFNSKWMGYGAYSFIREKWLEYNGNSIPELKDFLNISEIAIDPLDPGHIAGGSYGYGIAEFLDGQLTHIENESGNVLKPVTGYENEPGYLRITGIDFDQYGNLYAVSSNNKTPAYKKIPGGSWTALDLEYDGFGEEVNTGEILAGSAGELWLLINDKGIILLIKEENGVTIKEKSFLVKIKEGTAIDKVLSIAEDKEGAVWVGTNKGPVIYFDPEEIFDRDVTGFQPLIPRNDGSGFADLLLSSEQINDIKVDGANRKWLATEKSGVFLVSPDGKKEIFHFTQENSPLFSNSVQTLAVNDKTGEVFFGTEKGMISFRAGATEGDDDFGDVYVFPNPVRETFTGDITITGLASDVNVKITDIAGNLVFETTSLGGQALWNGKNFRGDRVQTGVYLVFCTNDDGSKTFVTKMLFIH